MFKNYFKGIEGIANYPLVLLVMFFVFFVVIAIWLWRADRTFLSNMSRIPLEDKNEFNDSETK